LKFQPPALVSNFIKSQAFCQNLLAAAVLAGNLPCHEQHEPQQPQAMDCAMAEFDHETCDLPLHLAGGGAGLCVGGG
jgi:hypothetical protein